MWHAGCTGFDDVPWAIICIFTALVLVSAWLALVGSAALGLVSIGVAPVFAMLLLAAANLLIACVGWLLMRRLSHWLGWAATQHAIKPAPIGEGEGGAARVFPAGLQPGLQH